jgi:hypothetical protein
MSCEKELQDKLDITPSTQLRRTLLKLTSTGALITLIPGRTAYAAISNSIVASGHGSDFAHGECMQVLSPGYWKTHTENWGAIANTTTFKSVFGGLPLNTSATATETTTLLQVLESPGQGESGLGGPNNVNYFLASFYLITANHSRLGIVFPVVGMGKPFTSRHDFASYLYNEALMDAGGVGTTLSEITNNYHLGNSCPA